MELPQIFQELFQVIYSEDMKVWVTDISFPGKCDDSTCSSLLSDVTPLVDCMTDPASTDCSGDYTYFQYNYTLIIR